jgi:hypothetical protein
MENSFLKSISNMESNTNNYPTLSSIPSGIPTAYLSTSISIKADELETTLTDIKSKGNIVFLTISIPKKIDYPGVCIPRDYLLSKIPLSFNFMKLLPGVDFHLFMVKLATFYGVELNIERASFKYKINLFHNRCSTKIKFNWYKALRRSMIFWRCFFILWGKW